MVRAQGSAPAELPEIRGTFRKMYSAKDAVADMENELLMQIRVKCLESVSVTGKTGKIVMIPFTGDASGPYFTGSVTGTGVDTQKIDPDGTIRLSARYMLEGTDCEGNTCRIFVENQGNRETGFTPSIITDSPALARWETDALHAEVDGIPEGVMVRIFRAGEVQK